MCVKAVAVVSVKLPQPQFEGQTKGKLNSDIKGRSEQLINERLGEYFDSIHRGAQDHRNALMPRRARSGRKARELTRRQIPMDSGGLPGKLADARSAIPRCEIFIVEGIGRRLAKGVSRASTGHPAAQRKNSERRKGATTRCSHRPWPNRGRFALDMKISTARIAPCNRQFPRQAAESIRICAASVLAPCEAASPRARHQCFAMILRASVECLSNIRRDAHDQLLDGP